MITRKSTTVKSRVKRSVALIKFGKNPIISPQPENGWEAWQTFNPGVLLLNDTVHFLYRAVGNDGLSQFGYGSSQDGFKVDERLPYPVYEHRFRDYRAPRVNFYSFASGGSFGGAEDPRPVRVGEEDMIYVTHTACDEGLRVALLSIRVKDFLAKVWKWSVPTLISPPGEVHKNWVIFPEKIKGRYAILTSINPEILITYRDSLAFNEGEYIESRYESKGLKTCWDNWVRGAGPPPIKTKHGWLLLYHAMDRNDPDKYKVGAMLLDLDDPAKILVRSREPILEPDEVYEYNGFKAGVVYASGAVVKNGTLLVYYGAADSCIGVAYADFNEFVENLAKGITPTLEKKALKKHA